MKTITATPAYGRDYSSKAKLLEDWFSEKDFIMQSLFYPTRPFSIRDKESLVKEGFTAIQFRYRKLQNTFILELTK